MTNEEQPSSPGGENISENNESDISAESSEQMRAQIDELVERYETKEISIISFAEDMLRLIAEMLDHERDTTINQQVVASFLGDVHKRAIAFPTSVASSADAVRIKELIGEVVDQQRLMHPLLELLLPSAAQHGFSDYQIDHWRELANDIIRSYSAGAAHIRRANKVKGFLILSILTEMLSKRLETLVVYCAEHRSAVPERDSNDFWRKLFEGDQGEQGVVSDIAALETYRSTLSQKELEIFGVEALRDRAVWTAFLLHPLPVGTERVESKRVRAEIIVALIRGQSTAAYRRLNEFSSVSDYGRMIAQEMNWNLLQNVVAGRKSVRVLAAQLKKTETTEAEPSGDELKDYDKHMFLNLASVEHPDSLVIHYGAFREGTYKMQTYKFDRIFYPYVPHALNQIERKQRIMAQINNGERLQKAVAAKHAEFDIRLHRGLLLNVHTPSGEIPLRSTIFDLGTIEEFNYTEACERLKGFMNTDTARFFFPDEREQVLQHLARWDAHVQQEQENEKIIELHARREHFKQLFQYRHHVLIRHYRLSQPSTVAVYYIHDIKNFDEELRTASVATDVDTMVDPVLYYSMGTMYKSESLLWRRTHCIRSSGALKQIINEAKDLGICNFQEQKIGALVEEYLKKQE